VPVPASLDQRLDEVGRWLAAALAEIGHSGPLPAIGFSNGGMMAGALAAGYPDLVSAAGLLSAAYPLPEEVTTRGGLAGTPVFIGAGEADPFHPLTVFEGGKRAYEGAGAKVTARLYPGIGHEITAEEVADLRAWLDGLEHR
jgi:phospholipase/carboxylesterase